jgi:RimJ/RimL family protein N-acetyltransferase
MHVAGEGNWMSRSFLWAMFDYPFRVCELKVAYAIICSTNRKSLRLVERVGFRYEHTLADYYAEGDAIIMSMRPSECRYLRGNTNG